jgi:hypothetical protein
MLYEFPDCAAALYLPRIRMPGLAAEEQPIAGAQEAHAA